MNVSMEWMHACMDILMHTYEKIPIGGFNLTFLSSLMCHIEIDAGRGSEGGGREGGRERWNEIKHMTQSQ